MKRRPEIQDLHRLLSYDAVTGILTWRSRGSVQWDAKYAGRSAAQMRPSGYIFVCVEKQNNLRAHHVAWAMTYGVWPEMDIDHIDGNRQNNAIVNLRLATPTQNAANSFRKDKNTSGFKGVSWRQRAKPWVAHIKVAGRSRYIGSFAEPDQAHAAYCDAARQAFGEFARTA